MTGRGRKANSRAFAKAAALQQGRFRESSHTITSSARTPGDAGWMHHGHLLALGHEIENLYPALRGEGGAVDFFAARDIKWWRSGATGDSKDSTGPTRNLTSSQLLCVNFLMPLGGHPQLLLRLLQSLDQDVVAVAPIRYTGPRGNELECLVDFEFVGIGGTLEGGRMTRGAHATSCDAVMLGRTSRGSLRAYLMEWKYGEQYVGATCKADGDSGTTRLKRYASRYTASDGPLTGSVPLKDVLYDPVYQIVRLGLLSDKLCQERALEIDEARVVVVCPRDNAPYRDTITTTVLKDLLPPGAKLEDAARYLWRDGAGFLMTSPEDFLAELRGALPGELVPWDLYMKERYGW